MKWRPIIVLMALACQAFMSMPAFGKAGGIAGLVSDDVAELNYEILLKLVPLPLSLCSPRLLFAEPIDLWEGNRMQLLLISLDREFEREMNGKKQKISRSAGVLSALGRFNQDKALTHLWIRVDGAKRGEWMALQVGNRSDQQTLDEKSLGLANPHSPFAVCHADFSSIPDNFWHDPCEGRELCESRVFFDLVSVKHSKAAGSENNETVELRARRYDLVHETIGRRSVNQWMIDNQNSLETPRLGSRLSLFEAQVPDSRRKAFKATVWEAGRPLPLKQYTFLAPPTSYPNELNGQSLQYLQSSEARPMQADLLGCKTESNGSDGHFNECRQVCVPRATAGHYGFVWHWSPMADARIYGWGQTDKRGCLPENAPTAFKIQLKNKSLSVQRLLDNKKPVEIELQRNGPLVFVEPGGSYYQKLVASNIFQWAREGLVGFGEDIYTWIPELILSRPFEVFQFPDLEDQRCDGFREPRRVHLPLTCPSTAGFVAKGLCGDLVLHEIAHEVMGTMVGKATDGRLWKVEDSEVGEGLADFFAVTLRRSHHQDNVFASNCANNQRTTSDGLGKDRDGLTAALTSFDGPSALVSRLASLAVLYGWRDLDHFLDEFFTLAVDITSLDKEEPEIFEALCKSFTKHGVINEIKQCKTKDFGAQVRLPTPTLRPSDVRGTVLEIGGQRTAWLAFSSEEGELETFEFSHPAGTIGKLWPGFSISARGYLQGWGLDGQLRSLNLLSNGKDALSPNDGEVWDWPTVNPETKLQGAGLVIDESPRREILSVDAFGLTLATWTDDSKQPTFEEIPWEAEVDSSSFKVGTSRTGTVFSVQKAYQISEGQDAVFRLDNLALEPVDQVVAFPEADPAVRFRYPSGIEKYIPIEKSLCKAEPYLSFARKVPNDERDSHTPLLALTCDGLASLILDGELERSKSLDAYVVPGAGDRPIQQGDINDDGVDEWILGPLVNGTGVEATYTIEVLDSNLEPYAQVMSSKKILSAPAVLKPDGEDADQIYFSTGEELCYWMQGFKKPECVRTQGRRLGFLTTP